MVNLKQSRVDLWNANPAPFRAFCTWDSDDRILRKCGITKGDESEEVSRITKNRARLDYTSVSRLTSYGCVSDEAFELVIGIGKPWKLKKFEAGLYPEADDFRELPVRGKIRITLDIERTMYPCPNCRTYCKVHEYETRSYSHPRIMRMATTIIALIPKLRCDVCDGYPQMAVPWARPHVSYTKMMEVEVFLLLQDIPVHETAVHCGLTDGVVWDMVRYRVGQALIWMDLSGVFLIYVDETSSKKGHTTSSSSVTRTVGSYSCARARARTQWIVWLNSSESTTGIQTTSSTSAVTWGRRTPAGYAGTSITPASSTTISMPSS